MTGIAIVGKISLIIHLIQNAFHDASISAIVSAASVLFTILFYSIRLPGYGVPVISECIRPKDYVSSFGTTSCHGCQRSITEQ